MLGGGIIVAALLACLVRGFRTESDVIKYPIPVIVNEETHVVVPKGGSAALYCKVACDCGTSIKPRITWLENGRTIVADGTKYASSLGVLHVKNCSSDTHNLVFKCVVSVGNWSVVGVERRIHVVDSSSPVLSLQKTNHALAVGASAILRCSSLDKQLLRSSTSNIVWFKDRKRIKFSAGTRNSSLPGGYLVIHPLVASDGGTYQCRYFVDALKHSVISNSVYLSVGPPKGIPSAPEFSYVTEDTEVAQRSSVAIVCAANGNPTPLVTISRENGLSSSAVVASGYGVANMTLPSVELKDAGKYTCNVKSGEAKLQRTVQVKVLSLPKFDKVPPKRKLTLKRTELSIACLASGVPEPSITWYKNGKRVVDSEKIELNDAGLLTLKEPRLEDAGIYQCIAANKAGSVSHSTFVFLEKSLRPPINVGATALTASSLNISWELNPVNNVNAMLAHVLSYEYNASASKRTKVIDDVSTTNQKIDELLGGTPYVVHVSTYGRNGVKSPNSKAVRVKTLESVPTISPGPITAVNLGNRVIRVIWTPIPLEFAKGKVTQYKVEYGIAGYSMEALVVPAGKTLVDIDNLRLGELYTIEVSAGTRAGFGTAAQTTIKIGDPEIADQKGPAMELRPVNSTAVEVDWSLSKPNYITGFILTYVPIVVADYWHSVRIVNLKPKQRSYILANLDPRKDYRIEIRIVSGPVQSKSSVIVHTANVMAPLPSDLASLKISNPRNLECAAKDNTSIFLSWDAPIHTDDIDHYTVEIELGGKTIEKYRLYHTRELKYLLENLSRGTWYYMRVNAVPKPERISEVSNRLKRKFKLPKFQSRMVACMTAEKRPGPPKNVGCNVTKNGLKAKAIWYPPEYPYGLITKYIVRYKHLVSSPRKTKWKIGTVAMEPNSKGYPLVYDLDADYYKKYRIEVSAVNGAGEGPAAVVKSCALRRAPTDPTGGVPDDSTKSKDGMISQDTKLGIIVGCSIASLFIFTFVVIFVWKNPFSIQASATCESF